MKKRLTVVGDAIGLCPRAAAWAQADGEERSDLRLRYALEQAASRADSFVDSQSAAQWLAKMSKRLRRRLPNPFYRTHLLRLIHAEAIRSGLDPELVLALIQVESGFDRFAVSRVGARGLMQVMPFWIDVIGATHDDLFQPTTNLQYGCRILSHYLRQTRGDLTEALALYNGSAGRTEYPDKVYLALRRTWK